MVFKLIRPLTVSAALLVASCSFVDDTLLPTLTGDTPSAKTGTDTSVPIAASSDAAAPAVMTLNPYKLGDVTTTAPTGTVVGERIEVLRTELTALRQRINGHSARFAGLQSATASNSQRYYGTIAAINTRLQIGTTKGNPILISQWNEAQADLEKIAVDVVEMTGLANGMAEDASEAGVLLSSTQSAFDLSGAIQEDHRQLTVLEDEASQTSVLVNRLLSQLTGDIGRQNAYMGLERSNLTDLSVAIENGGLLNSSASSQAYLKSEDSSSVDATNVLGDNRQALVIIRFDRDDVPYEEALYNAVSQTMQARPETSFDVVTIAPLQGDSGDIAANQAKSAENLQRVLRSLTNMGLPASRVSLSSISNAQIASNEVHIYTR
ncbi:MAG: hypothetical protein COB93_03960 [Sneathiella sp.]|nr:MAG: hypothetical protein COB93_03960 [Sneathiella sp.]